MSEEAIVLGHKVSWSRMWGHLSTDETYDVYVTIPPVDVAKDGLPASYGKPKAAASFAQGYEYEGIDFYDPEEMRREADAFRDAMYEAAKVLQEVIRRRAEGTI